MLRWLAFGLALAACESAPMSLPEGPEAPRSPHTREQLSAAADLQRAVVEGRLADARAGGALLSEMPAVHTPAQRIAEADDLAAAGVALGQVGQACGRCHATSGVHAALDPGPAPAAGSSLASQMKRHAWGATRLWQGVSGPDDRAWAEGSATIADTPIDIAQAMHDKPNVEAFELAEQLHDQAQRAGSSRDLGGRANLYGEVMATCASCHRIMRPQPVIHSDRENVARSR